MAVDELDYYSILQIKKEATQEEVRAAYKRLALLNHPDRSGSPQATEVMQRINQAFEILGSPEKRAEYDLQSPPPPAPAPADPAPPVSTRPAPPAPPVQPAPKSPAPPVVTPEQERQHLAGLRGQFKNIVRIMAVVMLLFFLSLLTGEVNPVAILLVIGATLYTVVSIIFKIRRPLAR